MTATPASPSEETKVVRATHPQEYEDCLGCRIVGSGALGAVGLYALGMTRARAPGSVVGKRIMGGVGILITNGFSAPLPPTIQTAIDVYEGHEALVTTPQSHSVRVLRYFKLHLPPPPARTYTSAIASRTSKMSVEVRCFQCKTKLLGFGTGDEHGRITGHSWRPGYFCTACKATFDSHKDCLAHVRQQHRASASGNSVGSTQPAQSLTGSGPPSLGAQPPLARSLPSGSGSEDFVLRTGVAIVKNTECRKCKVDFDTRQQLQEHYRESMEHPKCSSCGKGLFDMKDLLSHRTQCQSSSFVSSTAQSFTFGSQSAIPLNQRSPSSSNPAILSTARSISPISVSYHGSDDDEGNEGEDEGRGARTPFYTPSPRVQQPALSVLQNPFPPPSSRTTPGPDSARQLHPSPLLTSPPSPAASSITLPPTAVPPPLPLGLHCRKCLANPSIEPVTTLCGHIFCHRCIAHEFATKMCCPVCQRPFLVRLHLGS
ncbi:uncharacterized protein BXZ73DRAFT_78290 [Epithele typhae]|uniref:uncharacterized protein n=1 Tax=Epithele typhae TaxID=378194 RepID=UPI002008AAC2|nr:uncharacterized protein BXZ73DRAFT_78290 [Epithele typhae]KAH9928469.1 hypothetical protein BXZ73DRAFT_78290 [Epithele typhae]